MVAREVKWSVVMTVSYWKGCSSSVRRATVCGGGECRLMLMMLFCLKKKIHKA